MCVSVFVFVFTNLFVVFVFIGLFIYGLCLSLSVCLSVFVFINLFDCVFLYLSVCQSLSSTHSSVEMQYSETLLRTNFDDDIMNRFFVWTTVSQVWTFLAAAYIVIVPLFEEVTQPTFGLNILGPHFSLLRRELTKLYLIHIVMFMTWCLKDNFR